MTLPQILSAGLLRLIRRRRVIMRRRFESEFSRRSRGLIIMKSVHRSYVAPIPALAVGVAGRVFLPRLERSMLVTGILLHWANSTAVGTDIHTINIRVFNEKIPDTAAAFAANGRSLSGGVLSVASGINLLYIPIYHLSEPGGQEPIIGVEFTSSGSIDVTGGFVALDANPL